MADKILDRFTHWFCSKGGVWQTTLLTLVMVAVEVSDRRLDPHAFFLMALLTVYSAITQPALAYSNEAAARMLGDALVRIEALEKTNAEQLRQIYVIKGQTK